MKFFSFVGAILTLISLHAQAQTAISCRFGEKEIILTLADSQIVSAYWQNQDWGDYGTHVLNLGWMSYSASDNEVVLSNDTVIPEANGTYVCHWLTAKVTSCWPDDRLHLYAH